MPSTLDLELAATAFQIEKTAEQPGYRLAFTQGENRLAVILPPAAFDALVHQGQALIPSPNAQLTSPEVHAAWRQSAWPLKRLNDRSWQLLLREITSESLLLMLWFLKDVDVAKTVTRNMSLRTAAMLTEELIARYQGRDPDRAPASEAEAAHQALQEVLATLQRLVNESQIPEAT